MYNTYSVYFVNKILTYLPTLAYGSVGYPVTPRVYDNTTEINFCEELQAVSYTHLDVYKRQV